MRDSAHASRSHVLRWCAILIACLAAHATPAAVPDTISTEIVHVRFKTEMSLAALDSFATANGSVLITLLESGEYSLIVDRYATPRDTSLADVVARVQKQDGVESVTSSVEHVHILWESYPPDSLDPGWHEAGPLTQFSTQHVSVYVPVGEPDSTVRTLLMENGLQVLLAGPSGWRRNYICRVDRAIVPWEITAQIVAQRLLFRFAGLVSMAGAEGRVFVPNETPGAVQGVPTTLQWSVTPNPFNSTTTLRYNVGAAGRVSLSVYATSGILVKCLVPAQHMSAGSYTATWNGTNDAGRAVATAVYVVRLTTPTRTVARRVTLLR